MSTRAVLGRVEEEVAAITTRHDAAVARSGSLQRELEEQQHAAACEAEAAAATLRHAMETGAGQAAGAAQAAQAAQAAAERSVRGLQGQVNDLDQRLQQALAQACGSRTRSNLFPAAPDRASADRASADRASAPPSGAYAGGRAGTGGARFGARAEREC